MSLLLVEPATLVDLLHARALAQPDRLAYTFLVDGEAEEVHLSYEELDRRARAIAAQLQSLGATGERVLLLCPAGLDYVAAFFGCLYAGTVAIPAYPPRRNQSLDRIQSMVADARPAVAMTTAALLRTLEPQAAETPELERLHWLAVDGIEAGAEQAWRAPALAPETLAFLQYTSGSTGSPRGVMVSHGNLLHNSDIIARTLRLGPSSRGLTWLPLYHDLGLVGGMIQPLYSGFPVVMLSPVAFLHRPARWLQAVSLYRATVSGGPTFALDLCARRIGPEERAGLDLSSWQVAFIGGEPVRWDVLERFVEVFGPCGFSREALCPGYGLAEATMFFSASGPQDPPLVKAALSSALENHRLAETPPGHPDGRPLVGCGRNISDQRLVVVRPETLTRCGPGEVGELWIAGSSVARGYWNRPEETAAAFGNYLSDGDGPFLRTGDLGFVRDGELFVTGRLKDLIIIRGRNHYPQDIEQTVEQSHPALRPGCGAAFSVEAEGDERLVILHEVDRQWRDVDPTELAWAIRRAVAEHHELEVYAVVPLRPGGLPKTSSGKIRRRACRTAFLDGSLPIRGGSQRRACEGGETNDS